MAEENCSPGIYAWYVAVIMALCQMVSYIDRQLINLLVTPIKADFGLSDTEIGLLVGLAFTVVHVFLAIPIARMADRYSHRVALMICGVLWTISSLSCGLTSNFQQLFVARVGVGAAEAGIDPTHRLRS